MLFGVAGGIGEAWGLPPTVVRIAFILLALNGIGVVAYVAAVLFMPPQPGDSGAIPSLRPAYRFVSEHQKAVGAGLVVVGMLVGSLAVRWLAAGVLWPFAVVGGGLVFVWSGANESERDRWRSRASRLPGQRFGAASTRWGLVARVVGGAALVIVGLVVISAKLGNAGSVGQLLLAVVIAVAGLLLVLGPWVRGLWRAFLEERGARVRSEERAEVAAHLHDSVLQTLAMVQRHPSTPRDVSALARRQERELRSWLYPVPDRAPSSFAGAMTAAMTEVEDVYGVRIHLVLVGDCQTDPGIDAVISAAREAAANAAVHAGVFEVSVYAEAGDGGVEVFVRDTGVGFDLAQVPDGRRGVRDSIVGRLQRHSGVAEISSRHGEGTEVMLKVQR